MAVFNTAWNSVLVSGRISNFCFATRTSGNNLMNVIRPGIGYFKRSARQDSRFGCGGCSPDPYFRQPVAAP